MSRFLPSVSPSVSPFSAPVFDDMKRGSDPGFGPPGTLGPVVLDPGIWGPGDLGPAIQDAGIWMPGFWDPLASSLSPPVSSLYPPTRADGCTACESPKLNLYLLPSTFYLLPSIFYPLYSGFYL